MKKQEKEYYVTMTDTWFSKVKKMTCKLIFICNSYEEAEIVEENANKRTDQKRVNICSRFPIYPSHYNVEVKDKKEYPRWYRKGAKFK